MEQQETYPLVSITWAEFQTIRKFVQKYFGVNDIFNYNSNPYGLSYKGMLLIPEEVPIYYEVGIDRIFENDESIKKYITFINPQTLTAAIWILHFVNHILFRKKTVLWQKDTYNNADYPIDYGLHYKHKLRKELLELYIFCEEMEYTPMTKNNLKLSINKGEPNHTTLELENYDNYIVRSALKNYCISHLPDIHSVDEARTELAELKRAGRKLINPDSYWVIYGVYNMFKDMTNDSKATSAALVRIIGQYLYCIGLEDEKVALDEQNIAARIRYVLEHPELAVFRPFYETGGKELLTEGSEFKDLF
ncbi:hypothetical protein [uncultured Alistipes sp.]|uniref:hypothetical protein n=1 Tax=uncultured Alistipes sp. TaxID=538949 RepID=UPI002617430A|nr:hypothetical protein [uncultured Alistipes sp.]